MSWNLAKIEKLKAEGRIVDFKDDRKKPIKVPRSQIKGRSHAALTFIKSCLDDNKIPLCTEYQFDSKRKFRFDVAVPALKLAVEYEGLVGTGKKGGHQTKAGYTANCTKYNLAAGKGWTVYRYTSRNYKDFKKDLIEFLSGNQKSV